jgi:hypothetical protein
MLTKQAHFVRINKSITAQQLANIFIDHVYSKHGLPQLFVSDRDPRFDSQFWRTLFAALGTKLNMSTAYHPQTDGQTERTHRTLEQILRGYVHPLHDDWATWLPIAEFAYNSQYHSSTHASPFYANYGFHPTAPSALTLPSSTSPTAVSYFEHLRDIQVSIARELELEKAQQAEQANRHRRDLKFQIGDQVRLSTQHLTLYDQPSPKLRHRFLGPFTVISTIPPNCSDPVAYKLQLPSSMSRIHPVFHVSRLLPWTPSPPDEFPDRHIPDQPLPAAADFVTDAYVLDQILDVCIKKDPNFPHPNLLFLVHWAPPYADPKFNSWEPYRNLKKTTAMHVFLRSPTYQDFTTTASFKAFARRFPQKVPKLVTFAADS